MLYVHELSRVPAGALGPSSNHARRWCFMTHPRQSPGLEYDPTVASPAAQVVGEWARTSIRPCGVSNEGGGEGASTVGPRLTIHETTVHKYHHRRICPTAVKTVVSHSPCSARQKDLKNSRSRESQICGCSMCRGSKSAPLEDLARQAVAGDRDALNRLVGELQTDVYGLRCACCGTGGTPRMVRRPR